MQSTCFAIQIQKLNRSEINSTIEILGFGAGSRLLSNPWPLGGYSGLEIGVSHELIDTTDISNGSTEAEPQNKVTLNRLTVGKGLYYNFDGFLHFSPFSSKDHISEFGGLFKWCFLQSRKLPFSASAIVHYNSINYNDEFVNQLVGGDLMGGINVENLSFYVGAGWAQSESKFTTSILNVCTSNNNPTGCDSELTVNNRGIMEFVRYQAHTFFGVNFEFEKMFIAGQIDRYAQTVLAAQIGFRL